MKLRMGSHEVEEIPKTVGRKYSFNQSHRLWGAVRDSRSMEIDEDKIDDALLATLG